MSNYECKELLCCPFCGGEARLHVEQEFYFVACSKMKCPVQPRTPEYCSKPEVIAVWNTRATSGKDAIKQTDCNAWSLDETLDGLEYIAESPVPERGGFYI